MQDREKENALIADRIRQVRKGLGLNQVPFARKLGFEQATVSKWEKGKSRPTPSALVKLASIAEGIDKLFFLEHAGLPPEYFEGAKMIPEIQDASIRVVARAFGTEVPKEEQGSAKNKSSPSWDPELLAFVIETVDEQLHKRGKKLSRRKFAELVVLFYEFCSLSGSRDSDMVERLLKIA